MGIEVQRWSIAPQLIRTFREYKSSRPGASYGSHHEKFRKSKVCGADEFVRTSESTIWDLLAEYSIFSRRQWIAYRRNKEGKAPGGGKGLI